MKSFSVKKVTFETPQKSPFIIIISFYSTEYTSPEFQAKSFFDSSNENPEDLSKTSAIKCPEKFKCTKLMGQSESVCCPIQDDSSVAETQPEQEIFVRPQSSEC